MARASESNATSGIEKIKHSQENVGILTEIYGAYLEEAEMFSKCLGGDKIAVHVEIRWLRNELN